MIPNCLTCHIDVHDLLVKSWTLFIYNMHPEGLA